MTPGMRGTQSEGGVWNVRSADVHSLGMSGQGPRPLHGQPGAMLKGMNMFGIQVRRWVLGAALCAALTPGFAAVELVGAAPAATPDGLQVDNSTGPLDPVPTYMSAVSGTIDSIVWWGFHGSNSGGATLDDFIVKLNDSDQTGPLDVTTDANGLSRYELAIVDTPLVPGSFSLSVLNDSFDVEWFWQHDDQGQGGLAYALMGTRASVVPEPQSLALMLLGLAAIGVARRRG